MNIESQLLQLLDQRFFLLWNMLQWNAGKLGKSQCAILGCNCVEFPFQVLAIQLYFFINYINKYSIPMWFKCIEHIAHLNVDCTLINIVIKSYCCWLSIVPIIILSLHISLSRAGYNIHTGCVPVKFTMRQWECIALRFIYCSVSHIVCKGW